MSAKTHSEIHAEAIKAYESGKPISSNPYSRGTVDWSFWAGAYKQQRDVDRLFGARV